MDRRQIDDVEWANRSDYWANKSQEPTPIYWKKRRDRRALIICGHGIQMRIDRGTLYVKNGFTYYPQKQEIYRYFRGDPDLPLRIIIFDASGSISLDVLSWLGDQKIPLIQIGWRGDINCIVNSNYSANAKLVQNQRKSFENGNSQREFQNLIAQKFRNSIFTLKQLPDSSENLSAIEFLRSGIVVLSGNKTLSNDKMLGIEGRAAALYFGAWRTIPIKWKLSRRDVIPNDWHSVGSRRSAIGQTNRNARHPINSMLNYAYAILYTQVKIEIIAEGLDPTIGLSHSTRKYRDALVLDRMEPLRPIIDGFILNVILNDQLSPGDFTISKEGVCRLNPQLRRRIVNIANSSLLSKSPVSAKKSGPEEITKLLSRTNGHEGTDP